jgi:hypothetical protein
MVHSIFHRRRESDLGQDGFPHGVIESALFEDYDVALSAPYPALDFVAGPENVRHGAAGI